MSLFVAAVGALGLTLLVTGLPPLRRLTLLDRVDPFLPGAAPRSPIAPTHLLQTLAARLPGKDNELVDRLETAGLTPLPLAFRSEQIAWGLVATASVAALTIALATMGAAIEPASVPLLAVISAAAGYYARDWWLGKQVELRRREFRESFPVALDLVALSLIAGDPPNAALKRVGRVVGGAVGDAFDSILADERAGMPFLDALEKSKARIPDGALARFIDALAVGIEKGSPLADVLRAQADDVRQARGREILETAGRKEVLMLAPVVFLILPVVVLYALFPGLASLDLFVR